MELKSATPPAPYGDIVLENRTGNPLPPERLHQIRGILLHFNWRTERPQVLQRLAEIDVHGDVNADSQMGTFHDYRHQGWIVARVVPA